MKCNSGSRYARKKHLSGGAYVNFMMEEGEERIKASYRDNYERLAAVKSKYDPANFFHVNSEHQVRYII